jgi:hypothetical protein
VPDPSDVEQAVSMMVFLLFSLVGFLAAVLGLLIFPRTWLLAIVYTCVLVCVFLFFAHVTTGIVTSAFRWDVHETEAFRIDGTGPVEFSIFGILAGRERVYLRTFTDRHGQPYDITSYERTGFIALGLMILLGLAGLVAIVALDIAVLRARIV